MMSSLRSDWATPRNLFEILNQEFQFDLDACATNSAISKCARYFSPKENSLSEKCCWRRRVWVNPPYGRGLGDWVEKGYRSALIGDRQLTEYVVMLLPARTDTSWWHDYCMKGEIRFLRGRLSFDNQRKGRAPFPSAIVIFRALPSPILDNTYERS